MVRRERGSSWRVDLARVSRKCCVGVVAIKKVGFNERLRYEQLANRARLLGDLEAQLVLQETVGELANDRREIVVAARLEPHDHTRLIVATSEEDEGTVSEFVHAAAHRIQRVDTKVDGDRKATIGRRLRPRNR